MTSSSCHSQGPEYIWDWHLGGLMQFFCLLQSTSPVKRDSYSHPINHHEPVKHAETRIMISTSIYCTQLSLWNYTSTRMAESNNEILALVVYVLQNSGTAIDSSITILHAIRFASNGNISALLPICAGNSPVPSEMWDAIALIMTSV